MSIGSESNIHRGSFQFREGICELLFAVCVHNVGPLTINGLWLFEHP